MFNPITGTQVYYWSMHSRYLQYLGRVFILCCSFVLDLNHSDQRNKFCLQKVKYSCLQIWWLRWGIDICISWSNLPQSFKSCLNPGFFSNSLQSDLLSDSVDFGLKLPDLSRSELFIDMNYFNLLWSLLFSIYQFLPWFGLFLNWSVVLLYVLDL